MVLLDVTLRPPTISAFCFTIFLKESPTKIDSEKRGVALL